MVRNSLLIVTLLLFWDGTNAQPVQWSFHSKAVSQFEYVLTLSAAIAPGWHIYSQFMEEGGPTPTRLNFAQDQNFSLPGVAAEEGKAVKFHDDMYEMDITWYTGHVTFAQPVLLNHIIPSIGGSVEYLVCDEHTCIPGRQDFNIAIHPPGKLP